MKKKGGKNNSLKWTLFVEVPREQKGITEGRKKTPNNRTMKKAKKRGKR